MEGSLSNEAKTHLLNQLSLELSNKEGELKKHDIFSRWMINKLDAVDESPLQSTYDTYWTTLESEIIGDVSSMPNQEQFDSYLMGPSISQEQLFSIADSLQVEPLTPAARITSDKQCLISEINTLMIEVDDEWFNMFTPHKETQFSSNSGHDLFIEKLLKDKLHAWLLCKASKDGKGPSVLDEDGQGVIHLAAALRYDWVIRPTIIAGVKVNFRDAHGWTALHWAAFCGSCAFKSSQCKVKSFDVYHQDLGFYLPSH